MLCRANANSSSFRQGYRGGAGFSLGYSELEAKTTEAMRACRALQKRSMEKTKCRSSWGDHWLKVLRKVYSWDETLLLLGLQA